MSVALHLGDCLDVLRTLEPGSVDAVVTDPPFKLSEEYGPAVDPDNLTAVSSVWGMAAHSINAVKPGGVCVMFYDCRILPMAMRAMESAGWRYLRILTFYRRWGSAYMLNGWMSTSDPVLVYYKPGARPKFYGQASHDVYVRDKPEPDSTPHRAQKPAGYLTSLITRVCPPGGLVLDPYVGSGTTGVACVRTGRKFIGVEIDPGYYAIAQRRIAEEQAKTALLEPEA